MLVALTADFDLAKILRRCFAIVTTAWLFTAPASTIINMEVRMSAKITLKVQGEVGVGVGPGR